MLEKLWYAYEMARPAKYSGQEKERIDALEATEKKLLESLTEEQKELFEEFRNDMNILYGFSEKDAYYKGIRFATAYLLDALYGDKEIL